MRARSVRFVCLPTACVVALVCSCSAYGEDDAVLIASRYRPRVAHIETIGVLYTPGSAPEIEDGSGLLIGDAYVITNDHVLPHEENYKTLTINVRLEKRDSDPLPVKAIYRDGDRDLALIELDHAAKSGLDKACPMPIVSKAQSAPMGSHLYVLGFPLDQPLSISGGLISNQNANGRWQSDVVMNPGNSGGPAFLANGALAGLAVGGIVSWTFGGETHQVNGVNFFIPSIEILRSPIYAKLASLTIDRSCLKMFESTTMANIPYGRIEPSATISQTFTVDETKDDHPVVLAAHSRNYQRILEPAKGYSISTCSINSITANHVSDLGCSVAPEGGQATLKFTLQSGPAVDRWRGWWGGTITLLEKRRG